MLNINYSYDITAALFKIASVGVTAATTWKSKCNCAEHGTCSQILAIFMQHTVQNGGQLE